MWKLWNSGRDRSKSRSQKGVQDSTRPCGGSQLQPSTPSKYLAELVMLREPRRRWSRRGGYRQVPIPASTWDACGILRSPSSQARPGRKKGPDGCARPLACRLTLPSWQPADALCSSVQITGRSLGTTRFEFGFQTEALESATGQQPRTDSLEDAQPVSWWKKKKDHGPRCQCPAVLRSCGPAGCNGWMAEWLTDT